VKFHLCSEHFCVGGVFGGVVVGVRKITRVFRGGRSPSGVALYKGADAIYRSDAGRADSLSWANRA